MSAVPTYLALNVYIYYILCGRSGPVLTMATYIVFDDMVRKSLVSAFQNFFRIDNQVNIKKVMGRNVWMCFVLTALTYIALDGMVRKPPVSAFQNFFQIENQVNIKKIMGINVYCICFVSSALILCLNSVNIHNINIIQCISHR